MNSVVLVGRLTKDPELRYIPNSGTPVATFTIAIDRDYKKKDGTKETDFIPIEIIGKGAEFCANYITKGRLVAIQGNLRVDRYQTQDGENRTFTKVSGRSVQALDYSKDNQQGTNNITNPGLDPNGFQAIDDDDIPF
jgi:single-strand DNA-binding protein